MQTSSSERLAPHVHLAMAWIRLIFSFSLVLLGAEGEAGVGMICVVIAVSHEVKKCMQN